MTLMIRHTALKRPNSRRNFVFVSVIVIFIYIYGVQYLNTYSLLLNIITSNVRTI